VLHQLNNQQAFFTADWGTESSNPLALMFSPNSPELNLQEYVTDLANLLTPVYKMSQILQGMNVTSFI